MEMLTQTDGWVLTANGLFLTRDRGGSWTDITPEGVNTSVTSTGLPNNYVSGVTFLDPSHGWLVFGEKVSEDGALNVTIAATSDSGETWQTFRVASATGDDNLAPGGPAYIRFLDEERGWLEWRQGTGTQFSFGHLYGTSDGGATWEKLSIPLGEPVSFANENDGFVVGGPTGSAAYATHDGGESWEPVELPLPAEYKTQPVTYRAPTFFPSGAGVLPVTFRGPPAAFGYFTTEDSGRTWEFARGVDLPGELGLAQGFPIASDAVGPAEVIAIGTGGGRVVSVGPQDRAWSIVSPNGLPAAVLDIDFADESTGWALVQSSGCKQFKKDCWVSHQVYKTTDGGQTWSVLSVG